MKKALTVILAASLAVSAASLAACTNPNIYVDPAGNTYIAVTDENGATVLNDEGNIAVYETGTDGAIITAEDGTPRTVASIFPDALVQGGTVSTPTYTVKVPSGWKYASVGSSYAKNNSTAEMSIDVVDNTFDNYFIEASDVFETLAADQSEYTFTYEVSDFEYLAAGATAKRFHYVTDKDGASKTEDLIFFTNNGNLYVFRCSADTADYEAAGFETLYSQITYKPYLYY